MHRLLSDECRLYGSALMRSLVWGVLAGLQTGLLYLLVNPNNWITDGRTTVYQTFSTILGFLLVFRQNFSYSRYFDGRVKLQVLSVRVDAHGFRLKG
jgi:predicted membrane chloride channel (bestrophin family)